MPLAKVSKWEVRAGKDGVSGERPKPSSVSAALWGGFVEKGSKESETIWLDLVSWSVDLGQVRKGDMIIVSGQLRARTWEGKQRLSVVVDELHGVEAKKAETLPEGDMPF